MTQPITEPSTEARSYSLRLPTHEVGVLEWGPRSGDLVVALHGFPDTAWTWRAVASPLVAAGYRVTAPFLRGYAPSGLPGDGDYSVRALVRDAVALPERLGGGTPMLVGHDWGAIAANAVASDPASPYGRVVSLAVPPLPWLNPTRETLRPWLRAALRQPRHSWYIALSQVPGLAERHFAWLARRLWRDWSPGYDATEDLSRLFAAVPDRAHARAVVSYYRALRSRGVLPAMADPVAPVLYLQGDRDTAIDPEFFAVVEPRAQAPARAALVRDAGHFLHLEQPEAVAEHILGFLAS